jgi:uncharacterized protein with GYD domain
MIRAVMLIKSGGRVPRAVSLADELKSVPNVSDAYAVFGRFDVVAFFQGDDIKHIFRAVSKATKLAGLMSTETLVEIQGNKDSGDYGRGPFS